MPVRAAGSRARPDPVRRWTTWRSGRASPRRGGRSGRRPATSRPRRTWRSSASTSTRRRWSPPSPLRRRPASPSRARCAKTPSTRGACSSSTSRPRRFPSTRWTISWTASAALAALGVGVLYVTHHLGEVFRVANKVSVFRDGKVVGAGPVGDFDHNSIVHLLAGEELLAEEIGVPAAEGRPCGGPRTRDRVRDRGPPRRCAGRRLPDGRARRDRRDRGTGRVRPRHRARRVLRPSAARRRRGEGGGRPAAGVASRCRHRPWRGVCRAGPEDRRIRHDDERAREPDAAEPEALLEGRDRPAQSREGADQGVVRAAVGAAGERGRRSRSATFSGGNQQKILFGKWLSHGAIRLPPRRADPGSGRRRQGRPPS